MNQKELKKYIQEKIGQWISKLDVLKELFQKEEKKSKRKFIKREIEYFPSPELEDNKIYKFLKGYIITIISFIILFSFFNLLDGNFVALASILIWISLLFYIIKDRLSAYGWFAFLSLFSIPKILENFHQEVKVNPSAIEMKNFVNLEVWLIFIAFIVAMIIIYKCFGKDNKEVKEYLKENKI